MHDSSALAAKRRDMSQFIEDKQTRRYEPQSIVFVGAGNVATCMADVFKEKGLHVICVYSRTAESASTLAGKIGCDYVTELESMPKADIYIVMLKDDVLLSLADRIVAVCPEALFIHTSGSVPMSVWKDAGAVHYGVLYPMQTFSRAKKVRWDNLPVFPEASSDEDMETLSTIASTISGNVHPLSSELRCRMHLAAVFVTNFTNRMYGISEVLLKEAGLSFHLMLPMILETAAKVIKLNPVKAQSGPAARGDERVMSVHRELLKSHPEWLEMYNLISADIRKAVENGDRV